MLLATNLDAESNSIEMTGDGNKDSSTEGKVFQ
jgi:hypothetical protein